MADLVLNARLDDAQLRRDLTQLSGRVKSSMSSFASSFVGGLGLAGALGSVVSLRAGFNGLLNDMAAADRLMDTISKRQLVTARMRSEIASQVGGLQRLGIGEAESAGALDKLISITNDYEGSLRQLNLVTDLAIKLKGNWEMAIKVVGFVMKGEITTAGRLIPEIRTLTREHNDLAGSAKAVEVGLRAVGQYAGGSAVSEYNTLRGALNAVKHAAGEVMETLVEGATGGNDMVTSLHKINDLLLEISKNPGLSAIGSVFGKGGISGMAITGANMGTLSQEQVQQMRSKDTIFDWLGKKGLPALGYQTGYARTAASIAGSYVGPQPFRMGPDQPGFQNFGPEAPWDWMIRAREAQAKIDERNAGLPRGLEGVRMWEEMPTRRRGGIRGDVSIDPWEMGGRRRRGRNAVADRLLDEERGRQQQLQMGIQNAAEVGLTAALNGGSVREAMKQLFVQSLVQAFAQQASKSIMKMLFPVALGAATGGAGAAAGVAVPGMGTYESSVRLQQMAIARREAARG